LRAVQAVDDPNDVPNSCRQNFNGFSECYGAVVFNSVDEHGVLNYTIRADAGLFFVDVQRHTSDFEQRVFPLQWAVDRAIISVTTGVEMPTPAEWPFTNESNEEQALKTRLSPSSHFALYMLLYDLPHRFQLWRAKLISPGIAHRLSRCPLSSSGNLYRREKLRHGSTDGGDGLWKWSEDAVSCHSSWTIKLTLFKSHLLRGGICILPCLGHCRDHISLQDLYIEFAWAHCRCPYPSRVGRSCLPPIRVPLKSL
jgi:hypothetical protein